MALESSKDLPRDHCVHTQEKRLQMSGIWPVHTPLRKGVPRWGADSLFLRFLFSKLLKQNALLERNRKICTGKTPQKQRFWAKMRPKTRKNGLKMDQNRAFLTFFGLFFRANQAETLPLGEPEGKVWSISPEWRCRSAASLPRTPQRRKANPEPQSRPLRESPNSPSRCSPSGS